jgi:uncharacterized membrane protein YczE
MKRTIFLLICAVIGNALGTALMTNTSLGLTAWGSAAFNIGRFLNISFGTAFIIMAIVFYLIAILISKKINIIETILSFAFLFSFGMLSDLFIWLIPNMTEWNFVLRLVINFIGLGILIFSIALHLKVLIAVHPCDVFLYQMQTVCKNDALGTYITYGIAFLLAITFGLLFGEISGIGIGTLITVLFSGLMIKFYNQTLLKNLRISKVNKN